MKTYHWQHLETGKSGTDDFNESHAREADSVWMPDGITTLAALFLVNKWNAIAKAWKYWVD